MVSRRPARRRPVPQGRGGLMRDARAFAWAAGLFEGEGSVSMYRTPMGSTPRLQLTSTDEDVVRRFCSSVGLGRVHGPYPGRKPHHKLSWNWSVQNFERVQALLAMFWPRLGARRRSRAIEVLAEARRQAVRPSHRSHCRQGHALAGDNVYINCRGARVCKTCSNAQSRAYRSAHRAEVAASQRQRRHRLRKAED